MAAFRLPYLEKSTKASAAVLAMACHIVGCSDNVDREIDLTPPPIAREFRGVWIPTVSNLCWPSKPGLSVTDQQAELIALLDRASELHVNAVVFQVRPACDALYLSEVEPWSEYLTGTQGQAPSPFYDPLEFAVAEAHERGLELHAWFNPYRARSKRARSPVSASHISKRRPDLVRSYGNFLWLDPGEPAVQDYTLGVVLDVVKRYDIDAVHFDDYFYPYPEKNASGEELDFPDETSWKRFGESSGLSRGDWRRRNVDQFVQRVYQAIHDEKPYVKFGISPFGIWRPKHPPTIEGLDAYDKLYADARKWWRQGWCDYMAPQLYWSIEHPPTSFPVLLDWWSNDNVAKRHLFPGLNAVKTREDWSVTEISRQIQLTRSQSGSEGQILWSASALMENPSLESELAQSVYSEPALIPRFGWLDDVPPELPVATARLSKNGCFTVNWSPTGSEQVTRWGVQYSEGGEWKTRIFRGAVTSIQLNSQPEAIAVTAVDRCGNTSPAAVAKVVK